MKIERCCFGIDEENEQSGADEKIIKWRRILSRLNEKGYVYVNEQNQKERRLTELGKNKKEFCSTKKKTQ